MTNGSTAAQTTQALGDLNVLCLSAMGPVPFAAMLLGDLGAAVIRVDRPGRGEPLTGLPLEADPRTRGHRGIGIDLRAPAGGELLLKPAGRAEVFLEGMRPGTAEKLGLGPDELLAVNPGLVYGRATGWGQSGPRAAEAGHDISYAGLAGGVFPLGSAAAPPLPPLNLAAGLRSDQRGTNLLDGAAPYYRTYRTADGGFMAVGALEPQSHTSPNPASHQERNRSRRRHDLRQHDRRRRTRAQTARLQRA